MSLDALTVMKWLSEQDVNNFTLSYFPIDNRINKRCKCPRSLMIPLYEDLLKTMKKHAIPQTDDHEVLPIGVMPLETVILGTKDGYLYAINKKEDTQERLKKYSRMIHDGSIASLSNINKFVRVGQDFAILFQHEYEADQTCFRRASVIGVYGNYTYFSELDSGNLVEMPNGVNLPEESTEHLLHFFEEPSCITEYQLDEVKDPVEVLRQLIPIFESKSLDLVGFDPLGCGRWMPYAEVVKHT